ncbi:MAG: DegT/DnrJ/EryC1/StrS family aminotransferase [Bacteroidota bacterium]
METSKHISYFNLDRFFNLHSKTISDIFTDAMKDGQYIQGNETNELGKKLAAFTNRNHAITCGSGTDALFFALKSIAINGNDEILVPAFSFISTATAITRAGATPVFTDVDPGNGLMDLNDAKQKITGKTKAILFVDLYGNMPDVDAVETFAKTHNLSLVEDAAQAIGSAKNNRTAGSMGYVSILSFDPTKPVGAFGTGGAILTDDIKIANYCKAARQNGKNPKTGQYDQFGINSRISESQAALIQWQLDNFDEQLSVRKQLAQYYKQKLSDLPLKILVAEQFHYTGNFHKFVIQTKHRDALKQHLAKHGIETRIHYGKCMYEHRVLSDYHSHCPNAETLTNEVLSLPFYPELSIAEIDYICEHIKHYYS